MKSLGKAHLTAKCGRFLLCTDMITQAEMNNTRLTQSNFVFLARVN